MLLERSGVISELILILAGRVIFFAILRWWEFDSLLSSLLVRVFMPFYSGQL